MEKDHVLVEALSEEMEAGTGFAVIQGDVLRISFQDTIKQLRAMAGPESASRRIKVVANLPYNITTDILKVLLPMGKDIESIAFMLQLEVADRLTNPHPSVILPFPLFVAHLELLAILRQTIWNKLFGYVLSGTSYYLYCWERAERASC